MDFRMTIGKAVTFCPLASALPALFFSKHNGACSIGDGIERSMINDLEAIEVVFIFGLLRQELRSLVEVCRKLPLVLFRPKLERHDPGLAGIELGKGRSEEHTSELQSQSNLVCRLLLAKK